MEHCFKFESYAVRFQKSSDSNALVYYIDNLALAERFDWHGAEDVLKNLALDKPRFEQKMELILTLLSKETRNKLVSKIVDGTNVKDDFVFKATNYLEMVNPSYEFLYSLTQRYLLRPIKHEYLSIFLRYNGENKKAIYHALVRTLKNDLKLNCHYVDETNKNGLSVKEIFRGVEEKVWNIDDMPIELYRILKELGKAGKIHSYEKYTKNFYLVSNTQEEKEMYSKYWFSHLQRRFDSLSLDDGETKDDLAKALSITKNWSSHVAQTRWLGKKILETDSRNEYVFLRGLMNDEDAKDYVEMTMEKNQNLRRYFVKSYEDYRSKRLLGDLELIDELILFDKLPEENKITAKKSINRLFSGDLTNIPEPKIFVHMFKIASNEEGFKERFQNSKTLYEHSFGRATTRKLYIERMWPGYPRKESEVCHFLKHMVIKNGEGSISFWSKDQADISNPKGWQFMLSLTKGKAALTFEAIYRGDDGTLERYGAMNIDKKHVSIGTFKTVKKHRANLFAKALFSSIKEHMSEFEKIESFDPILSLIKSGLNCFQTEADRACNNNLFP